MSRSQLQDDLTRKVAEVVGATIDRELKIAAVALNAGEVTMLHLHLAGAAAIQAIGNGCGNLIEGADVEAMWDKMAHAFCSVLAEAKQPALAEVARVKALRTGGAA